MDKGETFDKCSTRRCNKSIARYLQFVKGVKVIKPSDYAYRAKKTIVGRHHRTTAAKTEITKRKQKLTLKRRKMEEPTITGRHRNRANCVKQAFYTGKNFPKENFS